MNYKYTVTIEIESTKALKAIPKQLLQERQILNFLETKRKATSDPDVCINWIDVVDMHAKDREFAKKWQESFYGMKND